MRALATEQASRARTDAERRSDGMSELSRSRGSEGYEVRDDEDTSAPKAL